jgi:hypothetical protein
MVRPSILKSSLVKSTRFEKEEYERMQEIASLESSYSGRKVSTQDLIREACRFVYGDGERLRECFRRSRHHANVGLARAS